jgi:hypothetical protein
MCCLFVFLLSFSVPESRPASQVREEFPLQLDHVLVWVSRGAPEAKAFESAGLQIQDRTNQHSGQGTASRVFIFANLYLELIWIEDEPAAARNAARTGIDMTTRAEWQKTGASLFGVGLHRQLGRNAAIPFPVTHYWAEWMRPDTIIEFAQTVTNPSEPMYFIVPDYISTGSPAMQGMLSERLKNSSHRLGVSRLSQLRIVQTGKKLTSTSELLSQGGIMKVELGTTPLLELTFDGGAQKKSADLRPQLPVVLKY